LHVLLIHNLPERRLLRAEQSALPANIDRLEFRAHLHVEIDANLLVDSHQNASLGLGSQARRLGGDRISAWIE
jgi:hypothetical protein